MPLWPFKWRRRSTDVADITIQTQRVRHNQDQYAIALKDVERDMEILVTTIQTERESTPR